MHYCTRFAGTLLVQAIYVCCPTTSNCHVCGDKAIAHMHYGGICCYSCKVSTGYLPITCVMFIFITALLKTTKSPFFAVLEGFWRAWYLHIWKSVPNREGQRVRFIADLYPKTAFLSRRISALNCFFCTKKICCALFLRVPVIHWYSTGSAPLC